MVAELMKHAGAMGLVLFVICGLVMTLYWEKEAVHRFGQEFRAVLRGDSPSRRRRRWMLLGTAAVTLLAVLQLAIGRGV